MARIGFNLCPALQDVSMSMLPNGERRASVGCAAGSMAAALFGTNREESDKEVFA
jgi:hypothetical protein